MNNQRGQLMQVDPALPPVGQRCDFGVRSERIAAVAAEKPHHRQVELAMPAVRSGVDEPASPVAVDETVARPQVPVQPGRRFVARTVALEPAGDPFDR